MRFLNTLLPLRLKTLPLVTTLFLTPMLVGHFEKEENNIELDLTEYNIVVESYSLNSLKRGSDNHKELGVIENKLTGCHYLFNFNTNKVESPLVDRQENIKGCKN